MTTQQGNQPAVQVRAQLSSPESDQVPMIDLGLGLDSSNRSNPDEIARSIALAIELSGFFYIKNHGVQPALLDRLVAQTQAFFAADQAVRKAIAIDRNNRGYLGTGEARMFGANQHDLKEVFFFGRELSAYDPDILAGVPLCAVNQWPSDRPDFRAAVLDYLSSVTVAGEKLLRAFAQVLGAEPDFFASRYQSPMARGQLIHYPAPDATSPLDQFGVAEHTDFGCMTLLYQHTPGLEVLSRQGKWLSVAPQEGTLVVNIGDLLERWSNGRLPSTRHRVRNRTGQSRYSIAVFYDPSPTALIDPADLPAATEATQTGFSPVGAADYILERSQGVFAQFDNTVGQKPVKAQG